MEINEVWPACDWAKHVLGLEVNSVPFFEMFTIYSKYRINF